MTNPTSEEEDVGTVMGEHDITRLLEALKDNRHASELQLSNLDSKFDAIPSQLEAIRKEQREANDALRRELQAYFLPKAEFNPHQQFVMTKFTEYDRIIAESRSNVTEWVVLKEDVKGLKKQQEQLEQAGAATLTKALAILAVVASVASVLIQVLQHIRFLP